MLKGDDKVYMQKCEDMIKENGSRIIINLNELRKKLPQRVSGSVCSSFSILSIVLNFQNYPDHSDRDSNNAKSVIRLEHD